MVEKKSKNIVAELVGIQIGEEAKGATVEWLTNELDAHTVIRTGGCQAGHHIVKADGREQAFSHFGCGTFDNAHTHLDHMVIEPVDLFDEAMELEENGVTDPLDMISIDVECISITPFHGALSRIKEILRGKNKKGTIGMGVGDAVKDSKNRPHLTIRAKNFLDKEDLLHEKIEVIRLAKLKEASELIEAFSKLSDIKDVDIENELSILKNESMVSVITSSMIYLADLVRIVGDDHLEKILSKPGSIVTEPSHGALLHPYAFAPHTTQVDPTSKELFKKIERQNKDKKIVRLGIGRCYMTRHGAGPLVSFDRKMTDSIHETHNNESEIANEWLGEFRIGHYDVIAARYALEIAGGVENFDGLMISYLDVLNQHEKWGVVETYTFEGEADDLDQYFELDGDVIVGIKIHPDTQDDDHLKHQLRLTELLKQCKPTVSYIKPAENKNLEETFFDYVENKTGVPVVAVSRGPKSSDREFRKSGKELFEIE